MLVVPGLSLIMLVPRQIFFLMGYVVVYSCVGLDGRYIYTTDLLKLDSTAKTGPRNTIDLSPYNYGTAQVQRHTRAQQVSICLH